MEAEPPHPAMSRLAASERNRIAREVLSSELAGTDLRTMLLDVFRRRAATVAPADVVRQYRSDRFVAPGQVDAIGLARIELQALEHADPGFEPLVLAPVVPFGTHSALGEVPQNNVITTSRLSEVMADPTNSLALEAVARRSALMQSDPRSGEAVHLAAVTRVVRAQHFEGPRSFAHFSLLGLISAGRDSGSKRFEAEALTKQLQVLSAVCRTVTAGPVKLLLTAFNADFAAVADEVGEACSSSEVTVERWPERTHGRHYYQNICFKVFAEVDGQELEFGDGGDVGWTRALLQNRKERLVISGLGLERLAML